MTIFYNVPDPSVTILPVPAEFEERPLRLPKFNTLSSENPATPFVPVTPDAAWWERYPTATQDGSNPDGFVPDYLEYERKHDPEFDKVAKFWRSLDEDKELQLAKGYIPGRTPKVYSGIDMKPIMTMPGREPFEFGDIQTMSISSHSESFPCRILGMRNALGFTRGARTIAGSMIFTTLDMYPWYKAIKSEQPLWKYGGEFPLADSLPPFDITITMSNEYEIYGAQMILFGVRIIDDGVVLSIDDLVTENTYSYVASGIAPIHRSRNWIISDKEDTARWRSEP